MTDDHAGLEPKSAHGKHLTITTYTGGCASGIVDVNPHFRVGQEGVLSVSIELVTEEGATIARSGEMYGEYTYPGELDQLHWRAEVPHGGWNVRVYGRLNQDDVTVDTATCRT